MWLEGVLLVLCGHSVQLGKGLQSFDEMPLLLVIFYRQFTAFWLDPYHHSIVLPDSSAFGLPIAPWRHFLRQSQEPPNLLLPHMTA